MTKLFGLAVSGRFFPKLLAVVYSSVALAACSPADSERLPLVVNVFGHSMSKLPFIIAMDQGFFQKYGLEVELQMPPPEFAAAIRPQPKFLNRVLRRLGLQTQPEYDILVTGQTPSLYYQTYYANTPRQIALATTDCSVRYYVIARPGIDSLNEVKGKRIGVNALRTTSAYAALRLAERMGWDPRFDITLIENGRSLNAIREGRVDVILGGDESYEDALREGFPVLLDTREWNDSLAGNSVMVGEGWLEEGNNREIARRFLQASLEGLAIYHNQPELAVDIAQRWYGFPTRELAQARYDRADYVPRLPYPCYEGIENVMRIHDSLAMRLNKAEDLYDDSILRELIDSGFAAELGL